ncbi:MmgE/PrpD family protein [Neorhizobium sp. NCHU2750]|uniref:MmgE/PrpD family protein n=1 Tax=Neorhizobium sp. NCHU2750 TaxID=1825976 RepID=UPI0013C47E18
MTTATRAYGAELAKSVAAIRYEDLPDDVVTITKLFILDTLGVIAGAAKAPGMKELVASLEAWETGGLSTLLLGSGKVNPVSAALANGAAAHALDFDDQHDPARVHVFCVVLPAVLATIEAEDRQISGRDIILAVAVGVEVFCRLGLACYNSLGKGWHPTTAFGTISAAAAVSKVFRMDEAQTLNALGLAFVQLSGTTQFIADGALAKRVGPGFAARSGVLAAHLARNGITGPHRFLEGNSGLFNLYERGEVKPEIIVGEFGKLWQVRDLSMKPFPCCRCTHTAIQLALDLKAQGLKATDVKSGLIELGEVNRKIVGAAFDRAHPTPVVHAQFNAAYAFAAALADGEVTIRSFTPDRIRADDVAYAATIETRSTPDYEETAIAPCRVSMTTHDGRILSAEKLTMKGAPDEPMTHAEVLAKFASCLDWGFGASGEPVERLQDFIMSLDSQGDGKQVIALFTQARGR